LIFYERVTQQGMKVVEERLREKVENVGAPEGIESVYDCNETIIHWWNQKKEFADFPGRESGMIEIDLTISMCQYS